MPVLFLKTKFPLLSIIEPVKYISNSAEETEKFASKLAQKFKDGAILALSGNLGAGKTTFTKGFAHGLGIKNKIISPTFVLIKEYPIPLKNNTKLYHIDLYRLENPEEIENLGLSDLFINPSNIILIEWAEKLKNLPKNTINITFEYISESKRQITIKD